MKIKNKNLRLSEYNSLSKAIKVHPWQIISLVGGGGKTTIMFALAKELALNNESVITTTTTRILEPEPLQTEFLIIQENERKTIELLNQNLKKYKRVTLVSNKSTSGKLTGISPLLVDKLARLKCAPFIIVEADGAAQKPLKAPNATEPVIPSLTSLVIAVIGIDALGSRLTEENVFRAEIASRLLNLPMGATISPKSIARLLLGNQGITRGTPAQARIVAFINKVDLEKDFPRAKKLASEILEIGYSRIERVVMGEADKPGSSLRVMFQS